MASANVTPRRYQTPGSRGSASWYLEKPVDQFLPILSPGTRVLDIGCGNGYWAGWFLQRGCTVVGIEPSPTGIAIARSSNPQGRFEQLGVSDNLLQQLNEPPFDLVVSFEVVEHLYSPRQWAKECYAALAPGGMLVGSTPYHGYFKNLLLSLTNKWDSHFGSLIEGGHIKFWSHTSVASLLTGVGFQEIAFRGAGRFPGAWKSMVFRAKRIA